MIEMILKVFGDEGVGIKQIKKWYRWFKNERTSIDMDPRFGRSSLTKTLENIEGVHLAIEDDHRLIVPELENDLGLLENTVASRPWSSKLLTIEQKIFYETHVCTANFGY